jgi:RNA polymerase sigma-70 factor (ECF subfamily)
MTATSHSALPTERDLESYRSVLTAHCYRMMGSPADADDAVQETLIKAWKALPTFEGRSSLKTWLNRIATRVCLDHLETRSRHLLEGRRLATRSDAHADLGPATPQALLDDVPLIPESPSVWVEPINDLAVGLTPDLDPAERAMTRQSVRLAFVTAVQTLAPRQRAALLMAEVLDLSAAEIADTLETSVPAVNSALQRARQTLARRAPLDTSSDALDTLAPSTSPIVDRFMEAFERYDVAALTRLLRDDAIMSMPPFRLWLEGPASIAAWLTGRGCGCRGSRLVPTSANGQPAFGQYRPGDTPGAPHKPWALIVLDLGPEPKHGHVDPAITGMTYFLDTAALFPRFGLPLELRT